MEKLIIVYPGLRYAQKKLNLQKKFGKSLFEYKIRVAVEKNQKNFLGQFQNYFLLSPFLLSPSKNAIKKCLHIWKLYD